MGSAACGKPFTIRRPPPGGAKRDVGSRFQVFPSQLEESFPIGRSRGAPPMPPTPPQNPPKIYQNSDLPKSALLEPIWSPMGSQRPPPNH